MYSFLKNYQKDFHCIILFPNDKILPKNLLNEIEEHIIYDIDIIIESGTCHGVSSEAMALCFPEKIIFTIDLLVDEGRHSEETARRRLSKYKNVTRIIGNSFDIIPEIIKKYHDKNIALFIDGPKGQTAISLFRRNINKNVFVCGFHDLKLQDVVGESFPNFQVNKDYKEYMEKYGCEKSRLFMNEPHFWYQGLANRQYYNRENIVVFTRTSSSKKNG